MLDGTRNSFGEEELFRQLCYSHYNKVNNIIRRRVRNVEDSQDLTQLTFIRAREAFSSYDKNRPFNNWINTIAMNLIRDYARYNKKWKFSNNERVIENNHHYSIESNIILNDFRDKIQEAIPQLREDYQEILKFRSNGAEYKEITELLELPKGTMMSKLYRARKDLISILLDTVPEIKKTLPSLRKLRFIELEDKEKQKLEDKINNIDADNITLNRINKLPYHQRIVFIGLNYCDISKEELSCYLNVPIDIIKSLNKFARNNEFVSDIVKGRLSSKIKKYDQFLTSEESIVLDYILEKKDKKLSSNSNNNLEELSKLLNQNNFYTSFLYHEVNSKIKQALDQGKFPIERSSLLDLRFKKTVNMYVQGYEIKYIAKQMGVKKESIYTYLTKARRMLGLNKKELESYIKTKQLSTGQYNKKEIIEASYDLPNQMGRVLRLNLEGHEISEISGILEVNNRTVSTYLTRAKKKLNISHTQFFNQGDDIEILEKEIIQIENVEEYLHLLAPKQAEAVYLREIQGLSNNQAAKAIDTKITTLSNNYMLGMRNIIKYQSLLVLN